MGVAAPSFAPGLAMLEFADEPILELRGALLRLKDAEYYNALVGLSPMDLRYAAPVAIRICRQARRMSDPTLQIDPGQHVCDPLPGVTAQLIPAPAEKPVYFNTDNVPDSRLTATEEADVLFNRVAPGPLRLVLSPPPGRHMDCRSNGPGWRTGENVFDVYAEQCFSVNTGEVVCTLDDP